MDNHPTLTKCKCGAWFHASLEKGMMCCASCKKLANRELKKKVDEYLKGEGFDADLYREKIERKRRYRNSKQNTKRS